VADKLSMCMGILCRKMIARDRMGPIGRKTAAWRRFGLATLALLLLGYPGSYFLITRTVSPTWNQDVEDRGAVSVFYLLPLSRVRIEVADTTDGSRSTFLSWREHPLEGFCHDVLWPMVWVDARYFNRFHRYWLTYNDPTGKWTASTPMLEYWGVGILESLDRLDRL